jgi:hypothetical protein
MIDEGIHTSVAESHSRRLSDSVLSSLQPIPSLECMVYRNTRGQRTDINPSHACLTTAHSLQKGRSLTPTTKKSVDFSWTVETMPTAPALGNLLLLSLLGQSHPPYELEDQEVSGGS